MAGYIGSKAAVVSSGAERKKTFDITTSTTSLTGLSYTVGQVHVFHNGVRLVDGTDYTATNSTSITLTAAAENGDQVVVISYASFQVADAYTQAEADAEFVNDPNGVITVDGSNVGIGTGSPSKALEVNGSSGELLRLSVTADGGTQQSFGIGFATGDTNTHPAALIEAEEFDASDSRADLVFSTRGTNSDVAPTEAMRIDSSGTVTANQFVGGGAIILVGGQSSGANYTTTSQNYQTATRFQITPSSSTSQLLGWFFCQMRATSGQSDGDMGNVARVHYIDSSGSWVAAGNLAHNIRNENGSSTGMQEIAVTLPILLTQDQLNASGVWDVAIRHYESYDATSAIDDGRLQYMEYEP